MQTIIGRRAPLIFIALSLSASLLTACSGPQETVEEITIVNGTPYDLIVDVRAPDGTAWLPIATVEAGSSNNPQEVIDQGETWVFRFRHWGEPAGEASFERADLESNDWRVEVPAEIAENLQALGRPPS